ncbi:MAG: GNAT family N-acetyltransferase [Silvanigrellaceae bacterium]|nr:GNAT family N-acetyltransferase [Silvanigrellaceae bacterium]
MENNNLDYIMQGRLEFFRSSSIYSPLPEAAFQSNGEGFYYYCSGVDFPLCNGIINQNNDIISELIIEKAIHFFQKRKLPFMWWSSDKMLEKMGFQFGGILTGIILDISEKIQQNQPTINLLTIKKIEEKNELDNFIKLTANGFGMNVKASEQFFAVNNSTMNSGKQLHFLALLDNVPVGTATLSISDSTLGIWNLTTILEHRRYGIGTSLVLAILLEARKLGYQYVIAILMPKGMASGLFARLGFKEICQLPFYVYDMPTKDVTIQVPLQH